MENSKNQARETSGQMTQAHLRISGVQSSGKPSGVKVHTPCGIPLMLRLEKSPHETNSGAQIHDDVALSN